MFELLSTELKVRDGTQEAPARDCRELFTLNPDLKSGTYWVSEVGCLLTNFLRIPRLLAQKSLPMDNFLKLFLSQ